MSAFMCDPEHISFLAIYAVRERIWAPWAPARLLEMNETEQTAEEVLARLLYDQNAASVRALYQDRVPIDPFVFVPSVRAQRVPAVQIIKSAKCYQYQACETDDFADSEARKVTDDIVMHAIQRLPGFDEAVWGFPA